MIPTNGTLPHGISELYPDSAPTLEPDLARLFMLRNTVRVMIDRPPTAVFPYLIEPNRLVQWLGGLVASEPLTEGGPGVGARSREIIEERGRRMTMDTEILLFEPPELLKVCLTATQLEGEGEYTLQAAGEQTRLTYHSALRFKGWLRIFEPLMKRSIQARLEQDMGRLKVCAEAEQP